MKQKWIGTLCIVICYLFYWIAFIGLWTAENLSVFWRVLCLVLLLVLFFLADRYLKRTFSKAFSYSSLSGFFLLLVQLFGQIGPYSAWLQISLQVIAVLLTLYALWCLWSDPQKVKSTL